MAAPLDQADIDAMIQAAVATAVAAAIGALPPPAQPVAQAAAGPAAVPFALSPAGAGNTPWDFQSSQGMKLYLAVTAPLVPLFNGDNGTLNAFLRQIWGRAESFGFTNILQVPDDNGRLRDLTREYGCLNMTNVQNRAIQYLRVPQREQQAADMLRKLIVNSMEPRVTDRMHHRRVNYTVDIALPGDPPDSRQDGPCMLKDLIDLVSVETKATVAQLTRQINNLQSIMEEHKSNIEHFNMKVEELTAALMARSAPVPDLLTTLFTAYKSCADRIFVQYMTNDESRG